MGRLTHYVFRSVWHVRTPFEDVWEVLSDVTTYADWWPEVRSVTPMGDGRYRMVARSLLPYELRFVSEEDPTDRGRGVIDARLSGDLVGTARFSITEEGEWCRIVYDQEVDTNRTLLNVLAPVARLPFVYNHTLMMRHGEAGLRAYLAGYLRGKA